jgi:diaminohydroxyphosphoribosylaminopyrimidine deaminase/5-amino-6-(5-phosphoribosylamino)uracil reductase
VDVVHPCAARTPETCRSEGAGVGTRTAVEPAEVERDAMARALDLARRGPAHGPNPRVGCVLLAAPGAGSRVRGRVPG